MEVSVVHCFIASRKYHYLTSFALDIHIGNILLRLPPGAGTKSVAISASPSVGTVSRKDGLPLEKGIPEYLVEPLQYNIKALDLESGDVQLVDFGSGMYLAISPRSFRSTNNGA
jgi:hypothetical protein